MENRQKKRPRLADVLIDSIVILFIIRTLAATAVRVVWPNLRLMHDAHFVAVWWLSATTAFIFSWCANRRDIDKSE